ncbi:MAG: Flp family type IVb pilin [Deltaproteobacteria bacterium]|jgi:pilus assembly protein Flp/PilA
MLKKFASFVKKEEGQALAEYGLILALIAVAAVAALIALGGGISTTLGSITANL